MASKKRVVQPVGSHKRLRLGFVSLIDAAMPVVIVMPKDAQYEKTLSNVQEVRARDGRVIAVVSEGDEEKDEGDEKKSDEEKGGAEKGDEK